MAFVRFNIVPDGDDFGPPSGDTWGAVVAFLLIVAGVAGLLKLAGVW